MEYKSGTTNLLSLFVRRGGKRFLFTQSLIIESFKDFGDVELNHLGNGVIRMIISRHTTKHYYDFDQDKVIDLFNNRDWNEIVSDIKEQFRSASAKLNDPQ